MENKRASFEAWAEGGAELQKMLGGEYSSRITRFGWEAYQEGIRAALASPEVQELLEALTDAITEEDAWGASNGWIDQARRACAQFAATEKQK